MHGLTFSRKMRTLGPVEVTLTELRRETRKALAALAASDTVKITSHGSEIGALVPTAPGTLPGRELAQRWRRHLANRRALAALARNMKGLR